MHLANMLSIVTTETDNFSDSNFFWRVSKLYFRHRTVIVTSCGTNILTWTCFIKRNDS